MSSIRVLEPLCSPQADPQAADAAPVAPDNADAAHSPARELESRVSRNQSEFLGARTPAPPPSPPGRNTGVEKTQKWSFCLWCWAARQALPFLDRPFNVSPAAFDSIFGCARARTHARRRTHARAHAHTHTHTGISDEEGGGERRERESATETGTGEEMECTQTLPPDVSLRTRYTFSPLPLALPLISFRERSFFPLAPL